MTPGEQVKQLLGLDNFDNAHIQRAINMSIPLFIVTVDSRFHDRIISVSRIKKTQTTRVYTFRTGEMKDIKLTPPLLLDRFNGRIPGNSVFIRRDLVGDYHIRSSMYEDTTGAKNIDIEVLSE